MSFNYCPEGRGFTVPKPMEDRTVELPKVRASAPTPIMAAPADQPLTAEHRKVMDEIDTLAREARTHLTAWDAREDDSDRAAAAAMGHAIKSAKQLIDVVRGLHSGLVLEDAITAVEDERESYAIRKSDSTGSV